MHFSFFNLVEKRISASLKGKPQFNKCDLNSFCRILHSQYSKVSESAQILF